MRVAIIGHTGMSGKMLTEILLRRGHQVTGLSLNAENAEKLEGLTSIECDIYNIEDLAEKLKGHDVVVSCFSGGHEVDLNVYYRQVEGTRAIIRAFKKAKGKYLIYMGGAASLDVKPGGVTMMEDERFPRWYYGIMPPVHERWLGDITGQTFFYDAAERKESGKIKINESDPELEEAVKDWTKVPLLEGCRAALEMFEGRRDFKWSFLSPPWFYRPGKGSGEYRLGVDYMIFENGVPAGIDLPDLQTAIADEVENQNLVYKHWTCAGKQQ